MDKKELKRDVASFATNLKDLMNKPLDESLATLDRDIQHFIYGRIALLIKNNDSKPIGSLNDVGAVTGAALSSVISAFCQNHPDQEQLAELFSNVRESMIYGFNARTPVFKVTTEDAEETSEFEEVVPETPVE